MGTRKLPNLSLRETANVMRKEELGSLNKEEKREGDPHTFLMTPILGEGPEEGMKKNGGGTGALRRYLLKGRRKVLDRKAPLPEGN